MKKYHDVEDIKIENGFLRLRVDGISIEKPVRAVSPMLAAATPEEQEKFYISPSGYGINWPLIDEDISIDGLLGILHAPEARREMA